MAKPYSLYMYLKLVSEYEQLRPELKRVDLINRPYVINNRTPSSKMEWKEESKKSVEVSKDRIVEHDQTIVNLLADKTGWVDSRSSLIFWNL